uniref:Zinc finger protein 276 n=1 Tax=Erpetoichthys calabaricus TaxID=27687 RepID=A0A8C4XFM9_ERPCA
MKRDRRGRFLPPTPGTRRGQLAEASRVPGGRRGKTRLTADGRTASEESQAGPQHQSEHSGVEEGVEISPSPVRKGVSEEGPEEIGRAVTTAFCRLCHGKFSSRSLRSAFGKASAIEKTSDKKHQKPQVFFADFQRLVGVPVMQDPVLSRYICKNCYSQFYKCHNILRTFIQRVNLSPVSSLRSKGSKVSAKKCESKEVKKKLEPKERKKPGPKPGWKKKIKSEREELPTIYKCPYQGCTAVYRGADGMKKHIKEHHEEVRERPCPHPGCNKVFMIDRYLQRHVKLIHTEVRNYICDECGQTFKQRKHLSVHQMRHSGAKPLQCEVCGFQCRQRASLKYHMTKHKAEAELEFACDQCGKRFEKAHNLNVHMSMVHPLTQNTDKNKSYETVQFIPSDEPQGIERLAETLADPIIHQEIAS